LAVQDLTLDPLLMFKYAVVTLRAMPNC
jgi:hypothetical protein